MPNKYVVLMEDTVLDEFESPEYLAEKAKWDAERERLAQASVESKVNPTPIYAPPSDWQKDPVGYREAQRKKMNDMKSAMEEYRNSAEFKAVEAERKATADEYERMSSIPVILRPERTGMVRKMGNTGPPGDPFFVVRLLSTETGEKAAHMQNHLPMPEEFMTRFALDEQEFVVETEIGSEDMFEAAEYVETQTRCTAWSIVQRCNRRKPSMAPVYIFSFAEMDAAALFKMRWG